MTRRLEHTPLRCGPEGLRRNRLIRALERADRTGLAVLVAPLGSGKTTLLQHWATSRVKPVRWLDPLQVSALPARSQEDCTVILDDAHEVSVEGLAVVAREIEARAPQTTFVVSSRRLPGFNFAHRGFPDPVVLTEDDLRFRPREVSQLYRQVYRTPLSDVACSELARVTDGWAAALHLAHLADSTGCPGGLDPSAGEGQSLHLVQQPCTRDYVSREVLDPLPPALVRFLQLTCVLERVTVQRCDALLSWDGSGSALGELAARLGLIRLDPRDPGCYRYHPVLRSHLRGQLIEVLGSVAARELATRAATLESGSDPGQTPCDATRTPRVGGLLLTERAVDPWRLEVRCLGDFELRLGGRIVDLTSVRPAAQTVLRALAVQAGEPIHREQLIDTFWPDLSAEAGLHNLHVAVSALRQCLRGVAPERPREVLTRRGAAYVLAHGEPLVTDVQWVQERLGVASRAAAQHDLARQCEALRDAVGRYADDVLPADGAAEWVVDLRDQLRHRVAWAAAALSALELEAGRTAPAVAAARRAVELDPWSDEAWRRLIEAHLGSGDPAQAAVARLAYVTRLRSLGVEADPFRGAQPLRSRPLDQLHLAQRHP